MAGKRKHPQGEGRPSSSSGAGGSGRPTATVFRKSAKKARLDGDVSTGSNSQTRKPVPGNSRGGATECNLKPPVKPKPQPQRTRPKDQPKPKTKHEFIQQKKAAALAEKEKEKAASVGAKKVEAKKAAERKAVNTMELGVRGQAKANGKGKGKKTKTKPVPPALVIPPPPAPATSFRIVTGSYERLLYGFQATLSPSTSEATLSVTLKPYFIFPAHVSAIKTVACGPEGSRWLATGGTDELIKIWDLKKRVEVGALTGHEGTITSLSFPSRTFLISTGSDGRINIFRARDWALLRTLKGHTGSINSAAVHPSGRLALSVGKDRTIRMWDLMRAKGAASTKLGVEGETIRWDSRGERFVVLSSTGAGEGIVFRTDMTRLHALEGMKRLHDVQFVRARMTRARAGAGEEEEGTVEVEHELMLVASEDKSVHVFDLDQSALEELEREQQKAKAKAGTGAEGDEEEDDDEEDEAVPLVEIGRLVGHGNRVKAVGIQHVLVPTSSPEPTSTSPATTLLATTICSDGQIRVFDLAPLLHLRSDPTSASSAIPAEAVPELEAIAAHDTKGSRLTCLSIASGGGGTKSAAERALAGKGRALSGENGDEDGEEDDEDDDADVGDEGDPFLDSDVGSESAVDTEDEDDDDEEDDDDVDLEAEAEELARLEKEIEEARKSGLEIPSDLEDDDDEDDDDEAFESFDVEGGDEDEDEEEDEGEDEEE
ncbi:unnamed protein product [Tilletia laevis]|uniref:Uncharacterized protein n=2 Tax=Tilletia TaxID=13289 RepID=A0A177UL72_9BASI|nr:hypothetical protein CF336_g2187 [Tilletia laevis]KAE8263444.1 hypothetical protein A4X03_0g1678 [Tilletia caries]CAD6945748.1 unnamed protein product [Tilletia controversa]KAE8206970.1 hypothetical protein CF335_g1489 [Tilletia laevis]CAD6887994.1 unnamed protein product [Tilletia caries]